jgi:zinc protease
MSHAAENPLAAAEAAGVIDIPFQKFVLGNGLTLIVHEDRKAPIVAFNVWYHVGSKNEKPGRTGFAHLFEHLMFNGSENYNDDYFKPMQKVGATDLNGTTSEDRTNYFENVPTPAVDLALWMESDRMGHLKGAIDQARLDEQRGVVQNEKRQYDNEPYSIAEELIAKACFPAGHPYSWTVIGSMDDLSAARLEDVQQWFAAYYGPNNAVIVMAGDIDAPTALAKVEQYFGDIPPGPPIARHQAWIARRSGEQRQVVEDRVPQARVIKIWNVPQAFSPENDLLVLAAQVLGSGKTSRLYKRLVYDDQVATDVSAFLDNREIASLFTIQADAKPGVDASRVEKAIDEELQRFLATGPDEKELEKVRMQHLARFIRGSERIGGFGGKSDILARSQVFGGSPDAYRRSLKNVAAATPGALKQAAGEWLADGVYTLEIRPFPRLAAGGTAVDRSRMPEPGEVPRLPPLLPGERLAGHPGGAPFSAAGAPGPHPGCRICYRPFRHSRNRGAGHGHARRRNGPAHLPADQRGTGPARRQPGHRVGCGLFLRGAVLAQGQAGRRPGYLCRRAAPSRLPRGGFPEAAEAADRPDTAGKKLSLHHGPACPSQVALRRRPRLRQSLFRLRL